MMTMENQNMSKWFAEEAPRTPEAWAWSTHENEANGGYVRPRRNTEPTVDIEDNGARKRTREGSVTAIAQLQGEEVKRQSAMLDQVNDKMDKVNERMVNVNTKLNTTLEEVGRSSDKLCVDIMCIVLAIGFGAVIYNFVKNDALK